MMKNLMLSLPFTELKYLATGRTTSSSVDLEPDIVCRKSLSNTWANTEPGPTGIYVKRDSIADELHLDFNTHRCTELLWPPR